MRRHAVRGEARGVDGVQVAVLERMHRREAWAGAVRATYATARFATCIQYVRCGLGGPLLGSVRYVQAHYVYPVRTVRRPRGVCVNIDEHGAALLRRDDFREARLHVVS